MLPESPRALHLWAWFWAVCAIFAWITLPIDFSVDHATIAVLLTNLAPAYFRLAKEAARG